MNGNSSRPLNFSGNILGFPHLEDALIFNDFGAASAPVACPCYLAITIGTESDAICLMAKWVCRLIGKGQVR